MMMDAPVHGQGFERQAMEALLKHVHVIRHEIPGVRQAADPECIHRMRVATRRLRTRLNLFEDYLPGKKARAWAKGLRRLTRALGEARDADVQLIFLESYLDTQALKREHAGIKRLMVRIRQQREMLQSQVLKALEKLENSGLLTEMEEVVQAALEAPIAEEGQPARQSPYGLARMAILARLKEVMGYEQVVRDPRHSDELHRMRIAAKHLRYCLEAFDDLFEGQMKKPIKAAKTIQEMLGDIHDCDVWMVLLPDFLAQEKLRAREYYGEAPSLWRLIPGIARLEQDRRTFRDQRYLAFRAYWDQHAPVWKKLTDMLYTAAQDPDMHALKRDTHEKRVGT